MMHIINIQNVAMMYIINIAIMNIINIAMMMHIKFVVWSPVAIKPDLLLIVLISLTMHHRKFIYTRYRSMYKAYCITQYILC